MYYIIYDTNIFVIIILLIFQYGLLINHKLNEYCLFRSCAKNI